MHTLASSVERKPRPAPEKKSWSFESTEEVELTGDVRIILAASDFSAELITSVLWLNKQGLDITCVRLKPYKLENHILIDATQIVPLPEAANYEIKITREGGQRTEG
jgi:hypothetical protein